MNPASTPFDADSTASEVVEGIDLSGRAVVVTDAASGIGVETARALAQCPLHVYPAVLAATKANVIAAGFAAKSPEQGAATSVLLATSPALEGIGGRYFEDCHEAEIVPEIVNGGVRVRGYALDRDHARRLWDVSLELPA